MDRRGGEIKKNIYKTYKGKFKEYFEKLMNINSEGKAIVVRLGGSRKVHEEGGIKGRK